MGDDFRFSDEDLDNFRKAFTSFAIDDRVDTKQDLGNLLRAVGFMPYQEEVEDMVEDIDEPTFDFDTFRYVAYRHARSVDLERELLDGFRIFDKKGEGVLPVPKVRQILQNLKRPFTDDQINELFLQAEVKLGATTIDYVDFVKVILDF
jgi:Ca2+-binding EF-hand superfamily protein